MKFWKFNRDLTETEPPFQVPTIEDIKQCYMSKSEPWYFTNLFYTGVAKIGGWAFDFREDLKKFVVKYGDGMFLEVYAPNKTAVRKKVHSRIEYILNAPK